VSANFLSVCGNATVLRLVVRGLCVHLLEECLNQLVEGAAGDCFYQFLVVFMAFLPFT